LKKDIATMMRSVSQKARQQMTPLAKAVVHLEEVVIEGRKRGIKSPTFHAIEIVLAELGLRT
jgi:hypothetical protein